MGRIKELFQLVREDLKKHGGRKLSSSVFIYFFNPSFRLVLNYRLGSFLYNSNNKLLKLLSYYYKYKQVTVRNCHISYDAVIGEKIHFGHPLGIVIGDGVRIGNGVKIWQNVTLGSHGKNGKLAYPIIKDNVKVYSGATIIGSVVIGEAATVAASALVNIDVPAGKTAVGIPAKIK